VPAFRIRQKVMALVVGLVFVVTACGDDDSEGSTASSTSSSTVVDTTELVYSEEYHDSYLAAFGRRTEIMAAVRQQAILDDFTEEDVLHNIAWLCAIVSQYGVTPEEAMTKLAKDIDPAGTDLGFLGALIAIRTTSSEYACPHAIGPPGT
jgi:hypothetical protein